MSIESLIASGYPSLFNLVRNSAKFVTLIVYVIVVGDRPCFLEYFSLQIIEFSLLEKENECLEQFYNLLHSYRAGFSLLYVVIC